MKFDETDVKIISALQKDARLSMRELGKKVHLSAPSVTERVKKLEDEGIISGYTIKINHKKLGFNIECIIEVTLRNGDFVHFKKFIKDYPGVLFCYRVTGQVCYILMLTASSLNEIEKFINSVTTYAETITNVVFSTLPTSDDLAQRSPYINE